MNCRHILVITALLAVSACNNASQADAQHEVGTIHNRPEEQPAFFTDSFPLPEDSAADHAQNLSETQQLELSKLILKDRKIKNPFDFSQLKQEQLPGTYRNFQSTIGKYNDSAESFQRYFSDFFERLQAQEELMVDTVNNQVRTRLEIARIKSDIRTGFALKKSQQKIR